MTDRHRIVILGLTMTSSWGNGHATTYRGLVRELARRKHDVLFLERDVPWYAPHRDLPRPPYGRTLLYSTLDELKDRFTREIRHADLVVVGSYVPDGIAVGDWVCATARGVTAFYDIDTPITARALVEGRCEYLNPALAGRYDLYLSFTGGPLLDELAERYGARPQPLYCAVDPALYHPSLEPARWALGYLGTYAADRQPALERLLLEPARRRPDSRFVVAGPMYPVELAWPANVERLTHVSPGEHRQFYAAQRLTLNLTRANMVEAGWSPSVRLFEAAACGVPIISDEWPGLDQFFTPGVEILVSRSAEETLALLELSPAECRAVAARARDRVLREHTAAHRAQALERYVQGAGEGDAQRAPHEQRKERESTWPRSW
jgi:spore maturation protein CgeB